MSTIKREDSYDEKEPIDSPSSPVKFDGARIEETVYNANLKAAIDNTHLDPWSSRAISLYFICMVGFLNAVSSGQFIGLLYEDSLHVLTIASVGFDGSLMGGINAMDQYLQFFHYKEVGASTGISEYLSRDLSMPYAALAIMAPLLNGGLSLTPLPSLPHVYRG